MGSGTVVFLVLSHHRPALVERLLGRLLEGERSLAVVHHDARATSVPAIPAGGRAVLMPEPGACKWGDISTPVAILRCLRWIRAEVPDFAWIVLVSGQDYPARSVRAIEAELLDSSADAFIHWEAVPPVARRRSTDWQRGTSRRYYWHFAPGTHRPIPLPRLRFFVDGLPIFAGALWWNLGRRPVERMLDHPGLTDDLVRRRFRRMLSPDEALFQTAVLNTSQGLHLVNSHRRFYRFSPHGGSAHPDTLTIDDLDPIQASGAFFARKVDEESSGELLDRLDRDAGVAATD